MTSFQSMAWLLSGYALDSAACGILKFETDSFSRNPVILRCRHVGSLEF